MWSTYLEVGEEGLEEGGRERGEGEGGGGRGRKEKGGTKREREKGRGRGRNGGVEEGEDLCVLHIGIMTVISVCWRYEVVE